MRVQTEEWRRFIPGVRMYKWKMTYFYKGEKLRKNGEYLIYNKEGRDKWEVIMDLQGIEIIPECTFDECHNIEMVIMSDSVKRIEYRAFRKCKSLEFVRLAKSLEFIGMAVFALCGSLVSIFISESCTKICDSAFGWCKKLIILTVPRHTTLGGDVIAGDTALIEASHFETNE